MFHLNVRLLVTSECMSQHVCGSVSLPSLEEGADCFAARAEGAGGG